MFLRVALQPHFSSEIPEGDGMKQTSRYVGVVANVESANAAAAGEFAVTKNS
jgi:hypothetical protein